MSVVVLSGSLPRKVPTGLYADVIRDMAKRRVRTGDRLRGRAAAPGVAAEPDLVSPNQREAEEIVGHEFQTDADFQQALTRSHDMGAAQRRHHARDRRYALLAAGPQTHRMYQVEVDPGRAGLAVGSGDALLAGFLTGRSAERGARGVPAAGRRLRHRQHPIGRRRRVRAA